MSKAICPFEVELRLNKLAARTLKEFEKEPELQDAFKKIVKSKARRG